VVGVGAGDLDAGEDSPEGEPSNEVIHGGWHVFEVNFEPLFEVGRRCHCGVENSSLFEKCTDWLCLSEGVFGQAFESCRGGLVDDVFEYVCRCAPGGPSNGSGWVR